ncbi:MAG TPA: hypothetical protein VFX42_07930 [Gemmatimonadales bacterium]|nr:hypothetical protein [Gemmatimonadales bacterium]
MRTTRLRVCDGEGERIVDASVSVIEQAFAPTVFIRSGTEISLSDGNQVLVALSLGRPEPTASDYAGEFLLSRVNGEHASLSGPVAREETLRQFREFMAAGITGKIEQGRGGAR